MMPRLPSLYELTEVSEPASARDMATALGVVLVSVALVTAGVTWLAIEIATAWAVL